MNTQEVANKLVELCRKGEYDKVYKDLYSPNVVSIEPAGAPLGERSEGIEAIYKKGEMWQNMVKEVHSTEISDPIAAENFFSCTMKMNITMNGAPGPMQMDEVCLYNVADGKIVSEQFFYTIVPQPA